MLKHEISFNNELIHFGEPDLPMLIHGQSGQGASFFTVCAAYDIFHRGGKILFFSAFHMAKDHFKSLLRGGEHEEVEFVSRGSKPEGKRAVILNSCQEEDLVWACRCLSDIEDRVVLIKNIEEYGDGLLRAVSSLDKLIVSGNLDHCRNVQPLVRKRFASKIFFSKPLQYPAYDLGRLPKYQAFISSDRFNGLIHTGEDYFSRTAKPEEATANEDDYSFI